MQKILTYLTRPFEKHLALLFIIFILSTSSSIYLHIFIYNAYAYSIYIALHSFLITYITTLIISSIPSYYTKKILFFLLITFLSIFFIIDFYCAYVLKTFLDPDFFSLIIATNINEVNEFMSSMVPWSYVILISSIFFLLYIASKFILHLKVTTTWSTILLLFVFVSILTSIRNPMVTKNCIDGRIVNIYSYDIPQNLRDYFVEPKLLKVGEAPKNLIVIMGESFSKHHSSLYGYNKCTNPRLNKLAEDSTLFVFKNVTSAGLTTMGSFKYMMSAYNPKDRNKNKKWYEYHLLHDILEQANFYTYWFSNHSNIGINNNVTRLLAETSNEYYYCSDHLSGDFKTSYDEEILEIAKPIIKQSDKHPNNFFLFHLMGSHFRFDLRYPPHKHKFTEDDYKDKPIHQRKTLAAYDNSILYNDSIVNEIINLFKNKDAIIIYLSDHGLDVYNSSDNYAAHGIHSNPISAKFGSEIPFLIYPTELYKKKRPDIIKDFSSQLNKPFRTDSLTQLITRLIGVNIIKEDQ